MRSDRHPKRGALAVVTLVCLVLLALVAVVQVAHTHQLSSDADQCPLCVAMHTGAPAALAAPTIVLVRLGMPALFVEVRAAVRPWHPTLFIRPPPAGC